MKEFHKNLKMVADIMLQLSIPREEAVARLELLGKSNIFKAYPKESPEGNAAISNFLSQPSHVLEERIAFEQCVEKCLRNIEFVKQYDKLNKRNLFRMMQISKQNIRVLGLEKEMVLFSKFVRETVFNPWKEEMIAKQQESQEAARKNEERNRYIRSGGDLGPTGHGDICMSDADPGL